MFGRVLSIQSHVIFGYVGNKSATFPLQLLGFEVDAINSVQFSNHTGYPVFRGQIMDEVSLNDLLEGLALNGLDTTYTHLLTGFIKDKSFLNCIVKNIESLKQKNPNLIFVCDPVLGDAGKLYVPDNLVPIYTQQVVPLADILTPNQTELQFLTGHPVDTFDNLFKAIDMIHEVGCRIVALSSAELSDNKDELLVVVSEKNNAARGIITIPKILHHFTGTGDLFASLFLAWLTRLNGNIYETLEMTIATIRSILIKTVTEIECNPSREISCKILELKLIQSKEEIERPKIEYKCKKVV